MLVNIKLFIDKFGVFQKMFHNIKKVVDYKNNLTKHTNKNLNRNNNFFFQMSYFIYKF